MTGLLNWPIEHDWVQIERRPMPLANLGPEFAGVTVVHVSDLHCGPFVRAAHLRRYVELVNSLAPDFVAITGDFITTARRRHARKVARVLSGLRPKVATLACLGNHDYGAWHPRMFGQSGGTADFLSHELAQAGIIVLRNSSRAFSRGDSVLQFAGVEDFWTPRYNPDEAFEYVQRDGPTICLTHNPDAAPDVAVRGAHWILAGHTHGKPTPASLFWDIVYPVRQKQFVAGEYPLGRRSRLYVNRGISNAMRYRPDHAPEITLFTMVREGGADGLHVRQQGRAGQEFDDHEQEMAELAPSK